MKKSKVERIKEKALNWIKRWHGEWCVSNVTEDAIEEAMSLTAKQIYKDLLKRMGNYVLTKEDIGEYFEVEWGVDIDDE